MNAGSWASKLEESLAAEQMRKHMRFSKPSILLPPAVKGCLIFV
jgi:hypothetical protein